MLWDSDKLTRQINLIAGSRLLQDNGKHIMVFSWNSLALEDCSSLSFENPSGKKVILNNKDSILAKQTQNLNRSSNLPEKC